MRHYRDIGEALNAYDNSSFINEDNSLQEHDGDSTQRPVFPAADNQGFNFQPFEVPRRELLIDKLPENRLLLFQHVIPISLVNNWVKYTNDWVSSLIQSGVIDSQEHPQRSMPHIKGVEMRLIVDMDAEIMGEPAFTTGNCHATGGRYAHYRIAGEAIPKRGSR